MLSLVDHVGYLAAFCTTLAFVPQAIKTIRYKETKALSLGMYCLLTVGVSLWLAYGILKSDYAIIAANAVTVVLAVLILITKIRCDGLSGAYKDE